MLYPEEMMEHSMSDNGLAIGIDLGTTNSLIAVFEEAGPRLIPNYSV